MNTYEIETIETIELTESFSEDGFKDMLETLAREALENQSIIPQANLYYNIRNSSYNF